MLGHRTLNVEDYLAVLRRRWYIILIPAILFPIAAYMFSFTIDPQYVSQTLILIEQQQVPTDYVRPVINEDLDSRLASMREQILSRSSLQPIIEKYDLYGGKRMSIDDRIDNARKSIDIKAIHSEITRSNGLPGFFISFRAADAHTAQLVCGEIAGLFIKQNLLSRADAVDQTTAFLKSQVEQAKQDLDDKDAQLATFQTQYFGKLPSDTSTNENVLTSLNSQLNATTQSIERLEQNRSLIEALMNDQSHTAPGSVVANQIAQRHESELQDLTTHYTAENPDVKSIHRRIADLKKQMADEASVTAPPPSTVPSRTDSIALQENRARLNGINLEIQSEKKQQADLQSQVRNYLSRIQSTPQVEEQYKKLTRDYGAAQDNYNQLQGKMIQAKAATALEKRQQGEQFRIMDAANLPDSPTYPKKSVFALGGLAAGLGLGLLITALLEYKDTSLRSERDIWAFTQLPTLAVVAWSSEVAHEKPNRFKRIKQLVSPKRHKDLLVDVDT
jgi:polysaccharide chain length determinant protein (PEP-CTERM system associated)